MSDAMVEAISETARRRKIQEEYNQKHGIVPKTIMKAIHEVVSNQDTDSTKKQEQPKMSKQEKVQLMLRIEEEMKEAAKRMDFERAMELRDILFELKSE